MILLEALMKSTNNDIRADGAQFEIAPILSPRTFALSLEAEVFGKHLESGCPKASYAQIGGKLPSGLAQGLP